jgi:hypothetical protein
VNVLRAWGESDGKLQIVSFGPTEARQPSRIRKLSLMENNKAPIIFPPHPFARLGNLLSAEP